MHRKQLLEQLAGYRKRWPEEHETTDRFTRFVQSHENCFDRALTVGHVTGSAWIVDHEQRSVVLMHHRKLDRWLQPGGHADGESNILVVALKETLEETGLQALPVSSEVFDLDIHCIPARGDEPAHEHFDVRFLLSVDRQTDLTGNDESLDLQWFDLDEIREPEYEISLTRMAEKLK